MISKAPPFRAGLITTGITTPRPRSASRSTVALETTGAFASCAFESRPGPSSATAEAETLAKIWRAASMTSGRVMAITIASARSSASGCGLRISDCGRRFPVFTACLAFRDGAALGRVGAFAFRGLEARLRDTRRPVLDAHCGELACQGLAHEGGTNDGRALEQSSEASAPVVTRPRGEEVRESSTIRSRRERVRRVHGPESGPGVRRLRFPLHGRRD
jgi:hypothetical protein